jgi:hypothetical protein
MRYELAPAEVLEVADALLFERMHSGRTSESKRHTFGHWPSGFSGPRRVSRKWRAARYADTRS